MTALPTPFDIIAPPAIAYEPGLFAWIGLLVLALIGAALLLLLSRSRRRHFSPDQSLELAVRQANALMTRPGQALTRAELNDLSLLLRRLVSVLTQIALDACSLTELRHCLTLPQCAQVNEILHELLKIEAQRFAPTIDNISRQEQLGSILSALERTRQNRKGSSK
ncbi:MAG: hypothetical protein K1X79_09600 [Oligoflexia bacterium]|nr:hypothetical protein [Oligoflexia bacterium]